MKNQTTSAQAENPLGTAPVGSLIAKFAIPAIISMLVRLSTVLVSENAERETPSASETGLKKVLSTPERMPLAAESSIQQSTMTQP